MRDLTLAGQVDPCEPDPLDVPDNGNSHRSVSQIDLRPLHVSTMMDAVHSIPPFEVFYASHSAEVLGLLRRSSAVTGPTTHSRRRSCVPFGPMTASTTASTSVPGC